MPDTGLSYGVDSVYGASNLFCFSPTKRIRRQEGEIDALTETDFSLTYFNKAFVSCYASSKRSNVLMARMTFSFVNVCSYRSRESNNL